MEIEIADVVGRIWVWTMILLIFWGLMALGWFFLLT